MSQAYVLLDRISALLQYVRRFPQQVRFDRFGMKLDKPTPFHQIEYCSQALLSGALPDAETLQFVAIALDKYVTSKGKLSLDEAFGLKSVPKAGNPSRQAAQYQQQTTLLGRMAMIRGGDPELSLEKAAEIALDGDESIKVETLVRAYSRRRCKLWEKGWAKVFAQERDGK